IAKIDQFARYQLIQAGNVTQERHTGSVEIDADLIDARFDHRFQRFFQFLAAHVVLIEADADIMRIHLDKFAQWVLQAPANRYPASQRGVVIGKFFSTYGAGGIDAGARFVDDHVGKLGSQAANQFSDDLFGLSAASAVAQCNHLESVFAHQVVEFGLG